MRCLWTFLSLCFSAWETPHTEHGSRFSPFSKLPDELRAEIGSYADTATLRGLARGSTKLRELVLDLDPTAALLETAAQRISGLSLNQLAVILTELRTLKPKLRDLRPYRTLKEALIREVVSFVNLNPNSRYESRRYFTVDRMVPLLEAEDRGLIAHMITILAEVSNIGGSQMFAPVSHLSYYRLYNHLQLDSETETILLEDQVADGALSRRDLIGPLARGTIRSPHIESLAQFYPELGPAIREALDLYGMDQSRFIASFFDRAGRSPEAFAAEELHNLELSLGALEQAIVRAPAIYAGFREPDIVAAQLAAHPAFIYPSWDKAKEYLAELAPLRQEVVVRELMRKPATASWARKLFEAFYKPCRGQPAKYGEGLALLLLHAKASAEEIHEFLTLIKTLPFSTPGLDKMLNYAILGCQLNIRQALELLNHVHKDHYLREGLYPVLYITYATEKSRTAATKKGVPLE